MKVSRDSWLVKWAYLLRHMNDEHIPHTTSVCVLFWRSVLLTPLHIVTFLVGVAGIVALLIVPWVVFPFHSVLAGWVGTAFVLLFIAWVLAYEDYEYKTAGELDFVALVTGYYDSIHSKVCPLVKIERR